MHARTTIIAATTVLLALPIDAGAAIDTATNGHAADVTIDAASAAWNQRIEWGLSRFREAGLSLPPLTISVHDDKEACDGNGGLFHPAAQAEIHMCSSSSPESRSARLITLHELAHAWAETQLTDDEQAALLRLRGLEVWVDTRWPPHEWGAEHAAEVVSWGLMDEVVPIIRIYDAEPPELLAAYELLVDAPPLWAR